MPVTPFFVVHPPEVKMSGQPADRKPFSLTFALLFFSILIVLPGSAAAGKLDTALCRQADLVTGEFQRVEELTAGANGFMVAVTSGYEDSVLINLFWEALAGQGQWQHQAVGK